MSGSGVGIYLKRQNARCEVEATVVLILFALYRTAILIVQMKLLLALVSGSPGVYDKIPESSLK